MNLPESYLKKCLELAKGATFLGIPFVEFTKDGMSLVKGHNIVLGFLTSEAASLLQQAKTYRDEMNKLASDDPRREVYEKAIRYFVDRADRISNIVISNS